MSILFTRATALSIAAGLILAMPISAAAAPGRYYVKFKKDAVAGVTREERARTRSDRIGRVGAKVLRNLHRINAVAAELTDDQIARLRQDSIVEYVEPDPERYLLSQVAPYGIGMVQADLVSDDLAGDITVCITDSGFDAFHEDHLGNNAFGFNNSGTGDWHFDGDGHGTHVAGTIAALNNNVGVLGVMPNANVNLHIVKVFANNGSWGYSSDLVTAVEVCQDNGAQVVNMSLGGPGFSAAEQSAMQNFYDDGMLLVAAAGHDGNTAHSYPASYDSVISVAAVDSGEQKADFSQANNQVELSAPGVGVLSTVPLNTGLEAGVTDFETSALGNVEALAMEFSVEGTVSGSLVDCGLGAAPCPPASAGNICLIERGNTTFAEKAQVCQAAGGAAAIIYNNVPGSFSGTLGGPGILIPVASIDQLDGAQLVTQKGTAQLTIETLQGYAYFDGTSMATPHVTGVSGLVWSRFPECTNQNIRDALSATAKDLGAAGRDNDYGFGLVQAKAAVDYLAANGCSGTLNQPPVADAGNDITTAPGTVFLLDGTDSFDTDGAIVSYSWKKLSGRVRARNSDTATPTIRVGPWPGEVVVIELTVTDDEGATDSDKVTITVQ